MPTLRDGTKSIDPRLTRMPWFDPKSWEYKVRDLFDADEPLRTKTWRCRAVLDQGNEGACTGFAAAHELIAAPTTVRKGIDNTFAREQLYWEAQKIDQWKGGAYPGADPFSEGSSVLAVMKVLKRLGYVPTYRWAFGVEDLKKAVSHIGPAVIGIPWRRSMFSPDEKGYLRINGEESGGHAILVRGINVHRKAFLLHNSWGAGWGNNGTAWIKWRAMKVLLKDGGEACIPVSRTRP